MNADLIVPDAVHICPGCDALCSGGRYCDRCEEEVEALARRHAMRANRLYSSLPRVQGVMPESLRQRIAGKLVRRGAAVIILAMWLYMIADMVSKGRGW